MKTRGAYLEDRREEERPAVGADKRAREVRPLLLLAALLLLAICRRDSKGRLLPRDDRLLVRLVRDAGAAGLPGLLEPVAERAGGVVGLGKPSG